MHAQAQQGEHHVYPGPDHPASNEFRARFHRSLVAPTPFGQPPGGVPPTAPEIDPSLTASSVAAVGGHPGEAVDGEGAQDEEEDS
jgi:hypothetical protein